MGWLDPVISIPRVSWARLELLVNEISYLRDGEELNGFELREEVELFIRNMVDTYVRQYFEDSTKTAAQLILNGRDSRKALR